MKNLERRLKKGQLLTPRLETAREQELVEATERNIQNTLEAKAWTQRQGQRAPVHRTRRDLCADCHCLSALPRSHATDTDDEIIQQSYFHWEDSHGDSPKRTEAVLRLAPRPLSTSSDGRGDRGVGGGSHLRIQSS